MPRGANISNSASCIANERQKCDLVIKIPLSGIDAIAPMILARGRRWFMRPVPGVFFQIQFLDE
jgi:hypothetical protein